MTPRMAAVRYVTPYADTVASGDYDARARRGLRPLSCAGADGGSAVAAVRRRLWLRMIAIAEAMNTVEYVPLIIPTIIVNAKPRSASPPKMNRASTDRNVVPAVMIVRDSVWFTLRFTISSSG